MRITSRNGFKRLKKIFDIADAASAQDESIESVVIIKRLPRFDKGPKDISRLKSDLSDYGNQVYDQQFMKRGRPEKGGIVELDLKCS